MSDKVRIIVAGDTGVGKTSFLHLLCYGQVLKKSNWTVGCNLEVYMHTFQNKEYFVEFIDIGGSQRYEHSRYVFYKDIDGVILVHDLANKKSFEHLKSWYKEITAQKNKASKRNRSISRESKSREYGTSSFLQYSQGSSSVPMLIIGNKCDLASDKTTNDNQADESGKADSLVISSKDGNTFKQGSDCLHRIQHFIDRVINRTLMNASPVMSGPMASYPSYNNNLNSNILSTSTTVSSYSTSLPSTSGTYSALSSLLSSSSQALNSSGPSDASMNTTDNVYRIKKDRRLSGSKSNWNARIDDDRLIGSPPKPSYFSGEHNFSFRAPNSDK
jgi:Rab-like protein 3